MDKELKWFNVVFKADVTEDCKNYCHADACADVFPSAHSAVFALPHIHHATITTQHRRKCAFWQLILGKHLGEKTCSPTAPLPGHNHWQAITI
jgi:hypothetical protein